MKKLKIPGIHLKWWGFISYGIMVCILNFEDFRIRILYDYHNISIVDHLGYQKTYIALKKNKLG